MSEKTTDTSQVVLSQLEAIGEGAVDDIKDSMELLENHPFFANLTTESDEAKTNVREGISALLFDGQLMERPDIAENDIEERLQMLLEKLKEEAQIKNDVKNQVQDTLDNNDTHAEFFKDLIDKSYGQKKLFFTAINDYTKENPEDRDLFVKTIKVLEKKAENEPETLDLQSKIGDLIRNLIEGSNFHPRFIKAFFGNSELGALRSEIEKALEVKLFPTPLPVTVDTAQKKDDVDDEKDEIELSEDKYLEFLSDFCEMNLNKEDADKVEKEIKKIKALKNLQSEDPKDKRLLAGVNENINLAIKLLMDEYSTPNELSQNEPGEKGIIAEGIKNSIQKKIIEQIVDKTIPKLTEEAQEKYEKESGIEDEEWVMGDDDDDDEEDEEDEEWEMGGETEDNNEPVEEDEEWEMGGETEDNNEPVEEDKSKEEDAKEPKKSEIATPVPISEKDKQSVESAKKLRGGIQNNEQLLTILTGEMEAVEAKLNAIDKNDSQKRRLPEKTKTKLAKLIETTNKLLAAEKTV